MVGMRWRGKARPGGAFAAMAVGMVAVLLAVSGCSGPAGVRRFRGHTDMVTAVAYGPQGDLVASASFDRTVRVWDAKTGKTRHTLSGHTEQLLAVAFSPDGKLLASGGWDGTVRLWDPRSGQELAVLEASRIGVHALAFSPDSTLLAVGTSDPSADLWDVRTRRLVRALTGHTKAVSGLAFADRGLLVSASWDATVRLWDPATGRQLRRIQVNPPEGEAPESDPPGGLNAVAVQPGTHRLAVVGGNRRVQLWDGDSGTLLHTLDTPKPPHYSATFSPDGRVLASSSGEDVVDLWDADTGALIHAFQGDTEGPDGLAFSPDGSALALACSDNNVRMLDVSHAAGAGG